MKHSNVSIQMVVRYFTHTVFTFFMFFLAQPTGCMDRITACQSNRVYKRSKNNNKCVLFYSPQQAINPKTRLILKPTIINRKHVGKNKKNTYTWLPKPAIRLRTNEMFKSKDYILKEEIIEFLTIERWQEQGKDEHIVPCVNGQKPLAQEEPDKFVEQFLTI